MGFKHQHYMKIQIALDVDGESLVRNYTTEEASELEWKSIVLDMIQTIEDSKNQMK
jgi:hypothetical protein